MHYATGPPVFLCKDDFLNTTANRAHYYKLLLLQMSHYRTIHSICLVYLSILQCTNYCCDVANRDSGVAVLQRRPLVIGNDAISQSELYSVNRG